MGDESFENVVGLAYSSGVDHLQSFPESSSNTADGISPRCFRAALQIARIEFRSRTKEVVVLCEVPPLVIPLQRRRLCGIRSRERALLRDVLIHFLMIRM